MKPKTFFTPDDFVPSLREALDKEPLDLKKVLKVGVAVKDPKTRPFVPAPGDRHSCFITDGTKACLWEVPSLSALFRGDKQPPVLGDYPQAYEDEFFMFDLHALEFSSVFGERRDAEMEEVYSLLRRRPEGKSLTPIHHYMWQAAALILGTRPLSRPEFEAIVARLERSCRTFGLGPTSRNYLATLHQTIGR